MECSITHLGAGRLAIGDSAMAAYVAGPPRTAAAYVSPSCYRRCQHGESAARDNRRYARTSAVVPIKMLAVQIWAFCAHELVKTRIAGVVSGGPGCCSMRCAAAYQRRPSSGSRPDRSAAGLRPAGRPDGGQRPLRPGLRARGAVRAGLAGYADEAGRIDDQAVVLAGRAQRGCQLSGA